MAQGSRFPNFEQDLGPNFLPIGTDEDLAEAARIAGSSRVYAALRPAEDTIDKVINTEYIFSWLVWPWGWPFIPCAVPCIMNRKAELRKTLYVITEDSILISIADYTPPCACGCTTGRDSNEISFDSITDVNIDNRGRGCTACRVPGVTISLVSKQVVLLVENTEGAAHLIRELRRAHKERRSGGAVVQQPVTVIHEPVGSSRKQGKRIFVAGSHQPDFFHIINLSGDSDEDWDKFLEAVRKNLNYHPKSQLKFRMADINAEVTGAEQLGNNDKIIATVEQ